MSGFVEWGEVIFLSHLKFSLQEWGFEKEVGNGEGRETDSGMGRLVLASLALATYLM